MSFKAACIVVAVLLLVYPLKPQLNASQRADPNPGAHTCCDEDPPFIAPPSGAPTVLNGTTAVSGQELRWRLFSPRIDSFQRGDFWLSFDVVSDSPANFHDLNLNVTCYDPDHTDKPPFSGDVFGGELVSWKLRVNGVFVQYMAFRNSSYFFLNSTHDHINYPPVDDEMIIFVSFVFVSRAYLFNITVKTETLFPEVLILSPVTIGSSGVRFLNSINRTLVVNASDPTGLRHSRLWAKPDFATSWADLLLLAANTTLVSCIPHQLTLSLGALADYATITNQSIERMLFDAILEVEDLTHRARFLYFELFFQNITAASTTTAPTTMTTNVTAEDWRGAMLFTAGFSLGIVVILSVYVLRTRASRAA